MFKHFAKLSKYIYFLLIFFCILYVGVILISNISKKEEEKIKEEMLVLTKTFAKSIDPKKIKSFQENIFDKENPNYKSTREKLLALGNINKVLGIRWIYTMIPQNGEIVFSVDSIPSDSPDYTDPGDIYKDASSDLVDAVYGAWIEGKSSITEPYVDQWGNFISVITPIVDIETNEIVSVLASDIDYNSFFLHKINEARRFPTLVLIFSELLFTILFFYILYIIKNKKKLVEKNIILKQYIENVPGVFFQYKISEDGKASMPYASSGLWKIFQVKPEEVVEDASKIFDLIHKDDIDALKKSITDSMNSLKIWEFEFRVNLPDGTRWLGAKSKPERLSDGSVLWYGYMSDVTFRKEMEFEMDKRAERIKEEMTEIENYSAKLKENRESLMSLMTDWSNTQKDLRKENYRTDMIISSMGEGLIIIDREYNITLINPKALDLIGYEKNEVLGKKINEIIKIIKHKKELLKEDWPTEISFNTNQIITTSLEDDLSITTERQKGCLAVTFSIAPLSNELESDPNKKGLIIVVRDANKDRELDRVKSGFISIASHQLRTPLTSVRWYSEMLLSGSYGVLSEAQKDLAKEINDAVARLYQTINVLLGISRIESGKMGNERIPIDLTKITSEVIKELSPIMTEKKLAYFSFSAQTDPIVVNLDPVTLRQVILNLFANSIRYTNDNGTIEGRWLVNKENKEVIYSVRDNGIGIPKNSQDKIFSKFYRADNAMLKVPDGTGLGLAFVKEIVTNWGGRVWFETEEGKGTTFFFTIPMVLE